MDYSLNFEETQTVSLLRESKVDWDNFDNSLLGIGDFFIKIDTIPNLLEVKTKNDSSEESNKILIENFFFDEIIETVHNLDTATDVNLNSIFLLESSESSSGISQLKISIQNHDEIIEKIIEKDHLDLTEIPPTPDPLKYNQKKNS